MCTYEDLVDATLPHGLIPLVVPQLRTITLGGAVTGLGIESTSFRNGLPHESVLEMDIFTGAGEVVTARPTASTRPVRHLPQLLRLARLRHPAADHARAGAGVRRAAPRAASTTPRLLAKTIAEIIETGEYDGVRVDGLDGVAFEPGEYYLTLARWTRRRGSARLDRPATTPASRSTTARSSSAETRPADDLRLPVALGHRLVLVLAAPSAPRTPSSAGSGRAGGAARDVYTRLLGLDRRFGIADRLDRRAGRPQRERVIQDVEVPVERLAEFLDWFDAEVGMRPVWLCPLVARPRTWPTYPLEPGATYVNVGFWGTVHVGPDAAERRRATARSRRRCTSSAATSRSTPRRSTTARPSTGSTTARTSPPSSGATTPRTG